MLGLCYDLATLFYVENYLRNSRPIFINSNLSPPSNEFLLTFRVSEHFHSAWEHGPEHAVMLGEGPYGRVVQGTTHIELHILRRAPFDHLHTVGN